MIAGEECIMTFPFQDFNATNNYMGIIPVISAPVASSCCGILSRQEIRKIKAFAEPKVERNVRRRTRQDIAPSRRKGHSQRKPLSTNLFEPHHSPLRLVATIGIHRTTLSFLVPALPSLFGLSSSPLAELMLAFLALCLSNRGRRSEANAVDAFAVVS
jgi:hypothetical protein